jgi:hypothetical protein
LVIVLSKSTIDVSLHSADDVDLRSVSDKQALALQLRVSRRDAKAHAENLLRVAYFVSDARYIFVQVCFSTKFAVAHDGFSRYPKDCAGDTES